jgi:hypothetical protein
MNSRVLTVTVGALAALALAGCSSSSKPASPTSTTVGAAPTTEVGGATTQPLVTLPPETVARAILLPAKVAPVSDECTLPVTRAGDGNVAPLLCPGGGVNRVAWARYAQGKVRDLPTTSSKTMRLGAQATAASVISAMCSDYTNLYGTNPLTISGEKLAAAYYGWTFSAGDPKISHFDHVNCP